MRDAENRANRIAVKLKRKDFRGVSYAIRGDGVIVVAKEPRSASSGNGQSNIHSKDKGRIEPGRVAEILALAPDDEDLLEVELFVEDESSEVFVEEHTYSGRKIPCNGYQYPTAFFRLGEEMVSQQLHIASGMYKGGERED